MKKVLRGCHHLKDWKYKNMDITLGGDEEVRCGERFIIFRNLGMIPLLCK